MMERRCRTSERRPLVARMLLGGIILLCMIGCDRMTRYRVLTFFFEGVPSPDGEGPETGDEVKIVVIKNTDSPGATNAVEANAGPDRLGQRLASRHEIAKDCAQCHTGGLNSGRQELRREAPDLCYSCHTDLHAEGDRLHGPLNVGECLFCHDPHQSAYIHLQKAPQPQLCYRCHEQEDVAAIPGHSERPDAICTECHDPHGSPDPLLLKAGWDMPRDADEEKTG